MAIGQRPRTAAAEIVATGWIPLRLARRWAAAERSRPGLSGDVVAGRSGADEPAIVAAGPAGRAVETSDPIAVATSHASRCCCRSHANTCSLMPTNRKLAGGRIGSTATAATSIAGVGFRQQTLASLAGVYLGFDSRAPLSLMQQPSIHALIRS